jgi:hypothetical protein
MTELAVFLIAAPAGFLLLAVGLLVIGEARSRRQSTELDNAIRGQLLMTAITNAERQAEIDAALADHDIFRYYGGSKETH